MSGQQAFFFFFFWKNLKTYFNLQIFWECQAIIVTQGSQGFYCGCRLLYSIQWLSYRSVTFLRTACFLSQTLSYGLLAGGILLALGWHVCWTKVTGWPAICFRDMQTVIGQQDHETVLTFKIVRMSVALMVVVHGNHRSHMHGLEKKTPPIKQFWSNAMWWGKTKDFSLITFIGLQT